MPPLNEIVIFCLVIVVAIIGIRFLDKKTKEIENQNKEQRIS